MRYLIVAALAALVCGVAYAQPSHDWTQTVATSGVSETVDDAGVDSSNRVAVFIYDYDSSTTTSSCQVRQYSSTGTLNWTFPITVSGATDIYPNALVVDPNGAIYVSFESEDGFNYQDYLLKLNSAGQEQWRVTTSFSAYVLLVDASGNVIAVDDDVESYNPANGNSNWTYSTGGYFEAAAIGSSGTIHVAWTYFGSVKQLGISLLDPANGNELQTSGAPQSFGDASVSQLIAAPSGETYLIGTVENATNPSNTDVAIWRYTSTATLQTFAQYPTANNDGAYVAQAIRTSSGQIIAVGATYDATYNNNSAVWAFDSAANLMWSVRNTSANYEFFEAVFVHSTQGIIAAGGRYPNSGGPTVGQMRSYAPSNGAVNWSSDLTAAGANPVVYRVLGLSNNDLVIAGDADSSSSAHSEAVVSRYNFSGGSTPALQINTPSLSNGQVGVSYSDTITATASGGATGPYTWSFGAGTPPPGLTLSGTTLSATFAGMPTTANTYVFDVTITNGSVSDTETYTVTITGAGVLTITTTSVGAATVGSSYSATINSIGGTGAHAWSITMGTLPAGLTLGAGPGSSTTISGTPTAATTVVLRVSVTDSSLTPQTTFQDLTLVINPAGGNGNGNDSSGNDSNCSTSGSSSLAWLVALLLIVGVWTSRRLKRDHR
ncbi:MAG: putative Ig domain-containing protein [Planctomycetes bacterium]|nr:putative Ig domain-containing protein [Planctomycetota bacterium]